MRTVVYAAAFAAALVGAVLTFAARADAQGRNRFPNQIQLPILVGPGSSIGVTVRDTDTGVVIQEVRPDSPASRAGLRQGDLVTEFDGERTRSAAQFTRLVRETAPDRSVKMSILRDGTPTTIEISPEAREPDDLRFPDIAGDIERRLRTLPRNFSFDFDFDRLRPDLAPFSPRRLGVTVTPLSEQLAAHFGVKQGVLVFEVAPGSAAEAAGIKAGDVITSIGGRPISSANDVAREVREAEPGASLEVAVTRERKEITLTAKAPERSQRARPLPLRGQPV